MGLFWFLFIISFIGKFVKATKKAASESKERGFDQQTVSQRLQELRKALEERAQQEAGASGSQRPAVMPQDRVDGPARQAAQHQQRVRRSRFEDYTPEPEHEKYSSMEGRSMGEIMGGSQYGSMEGTSAETLSESIGKERHGNLTPFQKQLLSKDIDQELPEGRVLEGKGFWKSDEMYEASAEMSEGAEGEDMESDMLYLSSADDASEVDLVGGINMKEMADAIVWAEIMGKPLLKRRRGMYGIGKHF